MFIGGLPIPVIEQFYALLKSVDSARVFVCCSGSFRSERTIHKFNPAAEIISNDVSFYSCVLGGWLADEPIDFRLIGELAWLEELLEGAEPKRRVAGAVLALELSDWAKGKPNPYKQRHFDHLKANAEAYLSTLQAKLAAAFGDLKLAGFRARDWVEHIDEAISEGATIVTFPPFYKGGYEALYRWLDARVEWQRPTYELFDPKDLPALVDKIDVSGSPYIFISDKLLERHEPRTLWRAPGRADHWLYASSGEAHVSRTESIGKPFAYKVLDPSKLTAKTQVRIERADGPRAMYIRSIYLKKTIAPVAGRANFFVWLDDMLAGVLVYSPSTFFHRPDSIYLMSDVSVTRERRVLKLISRLALNAVVLKTIEALLMQRIGFVETTAFSEHPVSMKYRGLFELLARREAKPPATGWQLQYGGEALLESPQQAYDWWWSNHGEDKQTSSRGQGRGSGRRGGRQLGAAGDRDRGNGLPDAAAADAERPVHDHGADEPAPG